MRLTVVVPLKGRHFFTLRLLCHASNLPYRFLLADGMVNGDLVDAVSKYRNVEHVRYPDDKSYSDYWNKMADAFSRVKTPYAQYLDNDDFVIQSGTDAALNFLDKNPDYVCARGRSVEFSAPGLYGKINMLRANHNYTDAPQDTAAERLRECGIRYALASAVYRTEVAQTLWRECAEFGFNDLVLQEDFFVLRALTLGKAHIDKSTISKYGQAHTGISSK